MSVSDQSLPEEVGKAAFDEENFKFYLHKNEIETIVFDFDRTLSVAEGFLTPNTHTNGNPATKENPFSTIEDLVGAYARDFKITLTPDNFIDVLMGGKPRREEIRRILEMCHGMTKTVVITNNNLKPLIQDVINRLIPDKVINVYTTRNAEIDDAEHMRYKCDVIGDEEELKSDKAVLFFDDVKGNFEKCDVLKVHKVHVTTTEGFKLEERTEHVRIKEVEKMFEREDVTTRTLARLLEWAGGPYFDPKSGIRFSMLSQTNVKNSSEEWVEHIKSEQVAGDSEVAEEPRSLKLTSTVDLPSWESQFLTFVRRLTTDDREREFEQMDDELENFRSELQKVPDALTLMRNVLEDYKTEIDQRYAKEELDNQRQTQKLLFVFLVYFDKFIKMGMGRLMKELSVGFGWIDNSFIQEFKEIKKAVDGKRSKSSKSSKSKSDWCTIC